MFGYSFRRAVRFVRARIDAALLACVLAGIGAGAASSREGVSEATLKAAIVANFFLFVEWPEPASATGGYRLCVAGRGETADAVLAKNGHMVKGQSIEAIRLAAPDAVPGRRCKILFIPASAGAVAAYLGARGYFPPLRFTAERFVLYSSRDSVGGGPYIVEAEYPLLAAPQALTRTAGG